MRLPDLTANLARAKFNGVHVDIRVPGPHGGDEGVEVTGQGTTHIGCCSRALNQNAVDCHPRIRNERVAQQGEHDRAIFSSRRQMNVRTDNLVDVGHDHLKRQLGAVLAQLKNSLPLVLLVYRWILFAPAQMLPKVLMNSVSDLEHHTRRNVELIPGSKRHTGLIAENIDFP